MYREGFHFKQVHVPTEPLELAGFCCDNIRLRDHRHGSRQLGWSENISGTAGVEDRFYNARLVKFCVIFFHCTTLP